MTGSGTPASVALGDLNRDGRPDLVTADYYSIDGDVIVCGKTVSVLTNQGNGSFGPRINSATGQCPRAAIGDVNGDGSPDIVTANDAHDEPHGVSVLANKGDGTFHPRRDYVTGWGPSQVAIGDVNGDGRPDLVTANSTSAGSTSAGTVSVLVNKGNGTFLPKRDYAAGRDGPNSVAIGDMSGDGKPDLATAQSVESTISVLVNNGDGTFRAERDYGTDGEPVSVAIDDLNGDGNPDLAATIRVVSAGSSAVSVFLNDGHGGFHGKVDYTIGGAPESIAIGDLNGDGNPELVTAKAESDVGMVSVLVNKGDGTFRPERDYPTGRHPLSVAIADLNGDGKPDLVTADYDGKTVSVLTNTS